MRDRLDGWRGAWAAALEGSGHEGTGRASFGHRGFGRHDSEDGGLRHGGRGRPGGRRRMFDSGELRLVLLHLMEAQSRHGYDLIREIETLTGGAYAPSPGIVYPTLTMLEELGQIEAVTSEGAKRAFTLTADGRAHLAEHRAAADSAVKRLEALRPEIGRSEATPVLRAMANLRTVIEQRLSGGPEKETLFAVADLLDEAARKIERL